MQRRADVSEGGGAAPIPAARLDHVAHAVPDLAAAIRFWRDVMGCAVGAPKEIPAQSIRIAYATLGDARVELMEPIGEASPIARFLERNPRGGLHHVCVVAQDARAAAEAARAAGIALLGDGAPSAGHHGRLLFFVDPRDAHGALIEVEAPEAQHASPESEKGSAA